ncbi:MAG: RNA polymerase sigma factor, partial [Planctomycetota bacterium]
MDSSLDFEELLGHSSWLQRLARALASDEAAADDLVQETLGVAMARRQPVRNSRAFLKGVLRRRFLEKRREAARRQRREATYGVDRATSAPAADVAAERVETLRRLLGELQSLPPAQRESLTLRFLDGKTPVEIALQTGVSSATVRAHISRGLATLRARLDAGRGGRAGWMGALFPGAPSSGLATLSCSRALEKSAPSGLSPSLGLASTTLFSGVTLMSTKALLAAVVPIAILGVWLGLSRGVSPLVDPSVSQMGLAEEASDHLAGVRPRSGVESRSPAAAELDVESAGALANSNVGDRTRAATPGVSTHAPLGTIVDERTGEPVPDLVVTIQSVKDRVKRAHSPSPVATRLDAGATYLTTDAEGRLRSDDNHAPGVYVLRVREQRQIPGRSAEPELRVQLPAVEPIEVAVGPTFSLTSPVPPSCGWEALHATWVSERSRGDRNLRTHVRSNQNPWIRFSAAVAELEGEGSWRIEFSDEEGLTAAHIEVDRHIDIEPRTLVLDFDSFGAIEFRAERSAER